MLALSFQVFADAHTVADNTLISPVVEENLNPNLANLILNTPYDAFYQINGSMGRGGEYRFRKVKANSSYPDERWEELALDLTKRLNFSGQANTAGSRAKPSATAYVVMFKNGIEGVNHTGSGESLALIMIDQKNAYNRDMPSVKASGKSIYLLDASMVQNTAAR